MMQITRLTSCSGWMLSCTWSVRQISTARSGRSFLCRRNISDILSPSPFLRLLIPAMFMFLSHFCGKRCTNCSPDYYHNWRLLVSSENTHDTRYVCRISTACFVIWTCNWCFELDISPSTNTLFSAHQLDFELTKPPGMQASIFDACPKPG